MLSASQVPQTPIEVAGRVVPAQHEEADVRVALVVEFYDDCEFEEYLVENVGRGRDLSEHLDERVTVAAWLKMLPSGEPLLRVRSFERW